MLQLLGRDCPFLLILTNARNIEPESIHLVSSRPKIRGCSSLCGLKRVTDSNSEADTNDKESMQKHAKPRKHLQGKDGKTVPAACMRTLATLARPKCSKIWQPVITERKITGARRSTAKPSAPYTDNRTRSAHQKCSPPPTLGTPRAQIQGNPV